MRCITKVTKVDCTGTFTRVSKLLRVSKKGKDTRLAHDETAHSETHTKQSVAFSIFHFSSRLYDVIKGIKSFSDTALFIRQNPLDP